ncbi:MAG: RNA polymerase factor sigma-54 [Gammaproteobacteria bacterium]|nr:MAG: RNA polymerase factor sigma-54 [Gammaproteobacteria bacterium]RLA11531.1 MAG: RNA polymerase factor sigma-54 [Gammaproteobacteria bacterium]
MKQTLELRVSQQLTMTPQLQQAIKLLQLSTLELEQEINEVLETNPLLEVEDDSVTNSTESVDFSTPEISENLNSAVTGDTKGDTTEVDSETGNAVDLSDANTIPDESPLDTDWQETFAETNYELLSGSAPANRQGEDLPDFTATAHKAETLTDHLTWQLDLTPFSERDRYIAEAIIDAVDANGYLRADLDDILTSLPVNDERPYHEAEVLTALHRVQQFDPPGVAARDLADCMTIQLNQFADDTPGRDGALAIVKHIELLAKRDFRQLMRQTKLDEEQVRTAITLIQQLNPRPGSAVVDEPTEYITPDVFLRKVGDEWKIELNPAIAPKLQVSALYSGLIKRRDTSETNTYLKNNLTEARWFINSLHSRNHTMLKVSKAIVDRQRDFFESGPEHMKPMVLHDIAEDVSMHESTISRVTNRKYMHTPAGIFELKYFFSSHVSTVNGGTASATAIQARIKALVDEETKALSDSKLATLLKEAGFNVARRTVAKYREAMKIPPSNERKADLSAGKF